MNDIEGKASDEAYHCGLRKQWDEASCPICMDHPHNAVLLLCSSHDNGCRSYICDTSYRHSNCLDRYKKPKFESRSSLSQSSSSLAGSLDNGLAGQRPLHPFSPQPILGVSRMTRLGGTPEENSERLIARLLVSEEENNIEGTGSYSETAIAPMDTIPDLRGERAVEEERGEGSSSESTSHLKCPLCRGSVEGFEIVKEARQYLDMKQRNCSRESCSFTGNYRELRRHARMVHPTTRPADVDPARLLAWHNLEIQREHDDIISAIRSAMPGTTVLGDYVIDDGDQSGDTRPGGSSSPWLSFFLLHMVGPLASVDEPWRLSRARRRHRRSSGAYSGQSNLWGLNLLGMQDDDDDNEGGNDDDDEWHLIHDEVGDIEVPRRRRRLSRSRSDDRP